MLYYLAPELFFSLHFYIYFFSVLCCFGFQKKNIEHVGTESRCVLPEKTSFQFNMHLPCIVTCLEINHSQEEELTGEFRSKYSNLPSQLNDLSSISIRRYYFKGKDIIRSSALASVIYIGTEYADGEVEVKFVSSKVRVAPIQR